MNQDQRFSEDQILGLKIIGLAVVGLVVVLSLSQAQKNNQLVCPLPNAAPAPVVHELPDLMAELRQAKTVGEGRAWAAIDLLSQRQDRAGLFQAQRLYEDAQGEFNGAIDYLETGLSRRFVDSDVPRIAARMVAGKQKIDRFADWVNNLNGPVIGAGPLDSMAEVLDKWLNRVSEENERAIEQLRSGLEKCRLKDWGQIMN